ncbi:PilL N-terminal domain-containing protein [Pseudomonas protegens]|uniref:PFGI-1 class ICE element type IV pilus protein PilL2 n=1 Tax=Pseudomonas protegens TaxID=380021 RepID=UPI00315902E1
MCPFPLWFHHPERRLLAGLFGLLCSVLAGGCTTTSAPLTPDAIEEVSAVPEPERLEFIPIVRYGRYTLVELAPTAVQRDLLLQIIDVSMPEDTRTTVGDGLRHVLKRSGYGLCQRAHAVNALYALPLPAAHLHLGPMTMRDALLTLAGPAWELHVDDRTRQICFERPGDDEKVEPVSEPPAAEAAQTFPLVGDQP